MLVRDVLVPVHDLLARAHHMAIPKATENESDSLQLAITWKSCSRACRPSSCFTNAGPAAEVDGAVNEEVEAIAKQAVDLILPAKSEAPGGSGGGGDTPPPPLQAQREGDAVGATQNDNGAAAQEPRGGGAGRNGVAGPEAR